MREQTNVFRHYRHLYPRADNNDELRGNYCQSRLYANLQVVTAGKLKFTKPIALKIYGNIT